jgi:transcriptional regulator NrdR family protein
VTRRLRCPFCLSLKTVEAMSATKTGDNLRFFRVCDDCDMSWSTDPKDDMYQPPAAKPAKGTKATPRPRGEWLRAKP